MLNRRTVSLITEQNDKKNPCYIPALNVSILLWARFGQNTLKFQV